MIFEIFLKWNISIVVKFVAILRIHLSYNFRHQNFPQEWEFQIEIFEIFLNSEQAYNLTRTSIHSLLKNWMDICKLYQFPETINICRIVSLIHSNKDAVCNRINQWDDPMKPSCWSWWMHERAGFGSIWLTAVHLDLYQNTDFWYFKMKDGQNSQPGWITRQGQSNFKQIDD